KDKRYFVVSHGLLCEMMTFDKYAIIGSEVPVAQWIEHRSPEPGAQVQFLSGTPFEPRPRFFFLVPRCCSALTVTVTATGFSRVSCCVSKVLRQLIASACNDGMVCEYVSNVILMFECPRSS